MAKKCFLVKIVAQIYVKTSLNHMTQTKSSPDFLQFTANHNTVVVGLDDPAEAMFGTDEDIDIFSTFNLDED